MTVVPSEYLIIQGLLPVKATLITVEVPEQIVVVPDNAAVTTLVVTEAVPEISAAAATQEPPCTETME